MTFDGERRNIRRAPLSSRQTQSRVPTDRENQGKMKIKFQVWRNQRNCKKVRQIKEKSGNFITGEIHPGILLWFTLDECENL